MGFVELDVTLKSARIILALGLYNPYNNDLFGINPFEREENFEYGKLIKFRKPPHFPHNL